MKISKFSKIKKGEYFRFPGKKKVYQFLGGGKVRGFNYIPVDDALSGGYTTKTDREIVIDFEY